MTLLTGLLIIHSVLIVFTLWLACGKPRPRGGNPFARFHRRLGNQRRNSAARAVVARGGVF